MPGVHRLMIWMGMVNVFLLEREGELALVDAGTPADGRAVLRALAGLRRDPREVRHILVTHYHGDHMGGLAALAAATGATVYAHTLEAPVVRVGAERPPLQGRGFDGHLLAALVNTLESRPPAASPVHRELAGGERLDIAGGLEAIHTPGHTPGHLVYLWHGAGGVLFTGDAAANNDGGPAPGIVNEDTMGADESFRALAGREFEVACFGHGASITRGARAALAQAAAGLR